MEDYYSDVCDDASVGGLTEIEDSSSSSNMEDDELLQEPEDDYDPIFELEQEEMYKPTYCTKRVRRICCWSLLSITVLTVILGGVFGYMASHWEDKSDIKAIPINGTIARTPPMGWNTWNQFGCHVSETLVRQMADAMHDLELTKLGYEYLIIDDCWHASERTADGSLQADPTLFPSGIPKLVEYVNSKGLKLGIYTDIGSKTCQGKPGSFGHYQQDIALFAAWGIEYVKIDYCDKTLDQILHPAPYYANLSQAVVDNGNKMIISVCEWGWASPWLWAPNIAHMWRTTLDIYPQWFRILQIVDSNEKLYPYAQPGRWNDPDMLEVGVSGFLFNNPNLATSWLDPVQSRSHFALWSMMSSPLILGNDLRNMSSWIKEIITKKEVIEINQDPLGKQGRKVSEEKYGVTVEDVCVTPAGCGNTQVWVKPLSSASWAVLLLNRGRAIDLNADYWKPENITLYWKDLEGVAEDQVVKVRDIWAGSDWGKWKGSFTVNGIAPNDMVLLKLVPVK